MSVIILCEINTAKMWLACQICDRSNGSLSTDNFFRTNFELPESIHSFCENNQNQHEDFLRACEAFKVWYCKGK